LEEVAVDWAPSSGEDLVVVWVLSLEDPAAASEVYPAGLEDSVVGLVASEVSSEDPVEVLEDFLVALVV